MIKFIVILFAVLGELYSVFLKIVRYRSANNPIPANVSDLYDAETYQRWKNYSAEHCRIEIGFDIASFAVVLILLFTNAYSAFAALFPATSFAQLFSVILLMLIMDFLFDVPKSYIQTMIIEEKYGFNRSSIKTFIKDMIIHMIGNLIIVMGLVLIMKFLHELTGDYLIVFFAVVIFFMTLLIAFLSPLLSRIGNKFVPLEDGELKDRLVALLERHGYRVKAIQVMDASRRTTKMNAYFTGLGKMKKIVLYDTLLQNMTNDEICAIFAHEMGHGLHKDIMKRQILNIGNLLILSAAVYFTVKFSVFCTAFGFNGLNYAFVFLIVSIWLEVLQPLTNFVLFANSRAAEYRADQQAVIEGYGEAMISALKKLARDNFAHLAPSKINILLEYTHPPIGERIDRIEQSNKKSSQK